MQKLIVYIYIYALHIFVLQNKEQNFSFPRQSFYFVPAVESVPYFFHLISSLEEWWPKKLLLFKKVFLNYFARMLLNRLLRVNLLKCLPLPDSQIALKVTAINSMLQSCWNRSDCTWTFIK